MLAASIQNNPAHEDPQRSVTVYLPPGYTTGKQSYPVIYFLHGYTSTDTEMVNWIGFQQLMDSAIRRGNLRPMIIVIPNSDTKYKGSFYTNSTLTGNWADFIARDIVAWTDKNYRTIRDRNARGLCGHSMGGNGALKIAMQNPDVFGAVYAMSPAVLDWASDFTLENPIFKTISTLNSSDKVFDKIEDAVQTWDQSTFYVGVLTSIARTYSPDIQRSAFKADFPVRYVQDSAIIDSQTVRKWEQNFPVNMIDSHISGLKSLAIKLDWGRNDDFPHIPITSMRFSKKLESLGIPHDAEEYIGDHGNRIAGFDGRVYTEMLPFFDAHLKFK